MRPAVAPWSRQVSNQFLQLHATWPACWSCDRRWERDHLSLPGRKPKELCKMRNETTAEHRGGKGARLSPRFPNFIFVLGALAWNYIASLLASLGLDADLRFLVWFPVFLVLTELRNL